MLVRKYLFFLFRKYIESCLLQIKDCYAIFYTIYEVNSLSLNNDDTQPPNLVYQKTALAAELYYIYHFTQNTIAKQLGVSRPWVSKLLKRAEELGIVRIEVMTPAASMSTLEQALIKKYNLKNAKVINDTPPQETLSSLGYTAAHYLISILKPNDILGVSWGVTLATIAESMVSLNYPKMTIVPLAGGLGNNPYILGNQIATQIATRLKCKCELLHIPAFAIGMSERAAFLNDPNIRATLNKAEQADIAVLGLGPLRGPTMHDPAYSYISHQELSDLEQLNVVGDVALHFLDQEGNKAPHNIHNRILTADLLKVRAHAREIIGVAFGDRKIPIIKAALKGKWINVLITDKKTAETLLNSTS